MNVISFRVLFMGYLFCDFVIVRFYYYVLFFSSCICVYVCVWWWIEWNIGCMKEGGGMFKYNIDVYNGRILKRLVK